MKIESSLNIGAEVWAMRHDLLTKITVGEVKIEHCVSRLYPNENSSSVSYIGTYLDIDKPEREDRPVFYFSEEDLGITVFGSRDQLVQDLVNKSPK